LFCFEDLGRSVEIFLYWFHILKAVERTDIISSV
jgi:hypothetical protein